MNSNTTNALLTFVMLMNSNFRPLSGKSVVNYLNNIIVFSKIKLKMSLILEMSSIVCKIQLYASHLNSNSMRRV